MSFVSATFKDKLRLLSAELNRARMACKSGAMVLQLSVFCRLCISLVASLVFVIEANMVKEFSIQKVFNRTFEL